MAVYIAGKTELRDVMRLYCIIIACFDKTPCLCRTYTRSQVSWEEDSQGTAGTMDTADNVRVGVSFSGIPDSDDGEDEDDEVFEAADNLDLGAVDLCVSLGHIQVEAVDVDYPFSPYPLQ